MKIKADRARSPVIGAGFNIGISRNYGGYLRITVQIGVWFYRFFLYLWPKSC